MPARCVIVLLAAGAALAQGPADLNAATVCRSRSAAFRPYRGETTIIRALIPHIDQTYRYCCGARGAGD